MSFLMIYLGSYMLIRFFTQDGMAVVSP